MALPLRNQYSENRAYRCRFEHQNVIQIPGASTMNYVNLVRLTMSKTHFLNIFYVHTSTACAVVAAAVFIA